MTTTTATTDICERETIVDVYGTTQQQLDCKLPRTGAEGFELGGLELTGAILAAGVLLVMIGVATRRLARFDR